MIVDIAVPNRGSIRTGLAVALLRMSRDERYHLNFHFRIAKPVVSSRNLIVQRFLSQPKEHGYLLMIDDDVIPQPDCNPLDLVELDLDVVGLLCPIWKGERPVGDNVLWNVMGFDDGGEERDTERGKILEVEGIGSGAFLIARRVLEAGVRFANAWDGNGIKTVSEDLEFCYRARAAGFGVWAALDYRCDQENTVSLMAIGRMQTAQRIGNSLYKMSEEVKDGN